MQDALILGLFIIFGFACFFLSGWNRERASHHDIHRCFAEVFARLLPARAGQEVSAERWVSDPSLAMVLMAREIKRLQDSPHTTAKDFNHQAAADVVKYKAWHDAVHDELIVCHIFGEDGNHEDPVKAIRHLCQWSADVSLDPQVSDAARALIAPNKERIAELSRGIRRLAEQALSLLAPCGED